MSTVARSDLPLPLLRRGKVREVYEVDPARLLLVASDRLSAFDVVMREPVPGKGVVLTQLSAFWFGKLRTATPHHCLTADVDSIVAEVPALASCRDGIEGRAMLVRRTQPVPFECVVRGYLAGSAWREYREAGTLAGEPLAGDMEESERFDVPVFSPATKAESGHDQNVPVARLVAALGEDMARRLEQRSLAVYQEAGTHAEGCGILLADTKFEFGLDADGELLLIDEVLTPDSSRFWPAEGYAPGAAQPSFDKQPVRDWLEALRRAGGWNGEPPPPELPSEVVGATSERYREIYERLTGRQLEAS